MRHLREKDRGKRTEPVDWSEDAIETLRNGYRSGGRKKAEAKPAPKSSECRTCSSTAPLWDRTCTDLNSLCYNSFSGQGQLLWVGVCLQHSFGRRFDLVSMVSINLGIWFYRVEQGEAGETIEHEEGSKYAGFQ
jgi:hypothetical protein